MFERFVLGTTENDSFSCRITLVQIGPMTNHNNGVTVAKL